MKLKGIYFFFFLFVILAIPMLCIAQPYWRHWRPKMIPQIISNLTPEDIRAMVKKLSYSEKDQEIILAVALLLPREEATIILCDYIKKYEEKNKLTDETWGRAVFSLGIVQTKTAKKFLLKLWNKYDEQYAKRKNPLKIIEIRQNFSPFRVIGDALHFYLYDEQIRNWFLKKIEEAETMPEVNDPLSPARIRKQDRYHLLVHLIRWDIIDSVDNGKIITPENILAFYPFTKTKIKNIDLSAEKIVKWVKKMNLLDSNITETEWKKIRNIPKEDILDSTVILIHQSSLAITLWEKYLKNKKKYEKIRNRLWLLTLWSFYHSLRGKKIGSWVPSKKQRDFLKDAVLYVESLPNSHFKKLVLETLWGISCFISENDKSKEVLKIRSLSLRNLDPGKRERIIYILNTSNLENDVK